MPAATTHNLFAKDLYQKLPTHYQNQITNLNMFYLGAQGPDFLFHDYMGLTPNSYTKFGHLLHEFNPYESINYMYHYCKKDSELLSYFYGYLAHYSLDTLVHPLVNYNAEFILKSTESHTIKHFRVEAAFDIYFLNQHHLSIKDFDVDQDIKISKKESYKLALMYYYMFIKVFKLNLNIKQIDSTLRRMSVFLKMLKPNNSLKYTVVNSLENTFKQKHFVTSLLLYNTTKLDIYNNDHKEYFNIDNTAIKYHYSLSELYDKAILEAINRMNNVEDSQLYLYDFNGNPLNLN